ncbi:MULTISPECIES: type I methionyl aminopeptidase [Cyanophyceae]|uniref:type I methionyl aminopeptidase n=1 Tax=Cyanophyceae TaxID=3028117 RepID=UPI001681ED6C|nr:MULTISPECIES: type I methionyl aminopeptidase [Cyanophyceae]MBD1917690.1 type I methionyl aminopeptidase [Phormidium sp. FACHB-77]MBD2031158.1 type I methionyl aminopeptidase [Phormidium sp. FACHB-322]MBD2053587.1 type I methionyl aminopeptidase [Leptolyngbya sp. FACHB-60]
MNFLANLIPGRADQATLPKRSRRVRGVELKTEAELEIMRGAARIVATVLKEIEALVQPGMTTADLDAHAEQRIRELGATPSFKGYHGFPASICACVNDQVVHGIPHKRQVIRRGDLLKVDTGAYYNGFHGDSCITVAVGEVSAQAQQLMTAAEAALYAGIAQVKPGNTLLDIAGAIEDCVTGYGFTVVEDFTGHGVGRNLHEAPSVFNFRTRQLPNMKLLPGMTLAIEPILNAGSKQTRTLKDQWTVVTVDRSLSAQFEHTVLVSETGYEILTDRSSIPVALAS